MKKSIFFLAASAIMFAMGSCTNDVLDNVQQVVHFRRHVLQRVMTGRMRMYLAKVHGM